MNENEMRQMFLNIALYEYFKMFKKEEFDETNVCSIGYINTNQEYKVNIDIRIKKVIK